jgi:kynurenine formamidase
MRLIDLTHAIHEDMPVYPGTEKPKLPIGCTLQEHGFLERKLTMFSHTGTHMDAPAHLIEGGAYLDGLPITQFFGKAVLIDVAGWAGRRIMTADLLEHASRIAAAEFVILRTGWSGYWGADAYFEGFPVLDPGAAQWLAAGGLKGVGVDAISVDPTDSTGYEVHKALLGNGLVIVENLTNLEALPAEGFHVSCFPLAIRDADGSPVRAVAHVGLGCAADSPQE